MNHVYKIPAAFVFVLMVIFLNCSRTAEKSTDDGDEESGTELALNETYDKTRNGAHLILNYDAETNSFIGTVENTTDETLKQVRVEVHLSNGKELGPTPASDLKPGEIKDVHLKATSRDFDGWSAHPEVGSGEHGDREEHAEEGGEHGQEGGEHGREGGEHAEEGGEHAEEDKN